MFFRLNFWLFIFWDLNSSFNRFLLLLFAYEEGLVEQAKKANLCIIGTWDFFFFVNGWFNLPVCQMFSFLLFVIYQSQNTFVAIVDLPEGEHQYKFYVDGQWTHDPAEVSHYSHSHLWPVVKQAYFTLLT